jgi:hypothetical protein
MRSFSALHKSARMPVIHYVREERERQKYVDVAAVNKDKNHIDSLQKGNSIETIWLKT